MIYLNLRSVNIMEDTWFNVEEFADSDEVGFIDYDISTNPNDFNINTLYSLVDSGVIRLPVFQRKYVWDQKRASKLIESIVMGLPIPQLFFYQSDANEFLVIDGQQRLLSIYFFMKQRFPTDEGRKKLHEILSGKESIDAKFLNNDKYFKDFKLKLPDIICGGVSEKNKLSGLKFETLDTYKHTFEFIRTIRCMIIKQNSPSDDIGSIFEIFNRLNTGGQNLSPQEIRMSMFYNEFYIKLLDMNNDQRWRRLLNLKNADLHFKDVEILLRSFAMLAQYENYASPMNNFLNKFSAMSKKFPIETILYFEELFYAFLDCCRDLDATAFASKSNKFSISLFEAIFVAVCHKAFADKTLPNTLVNKSAIEQLKADATFIKATQDSVASRTSVQNRIAKAIEFLG